MAAHNELGKRGEQVAIDHLKSKGYEILEKFLSEADKFMKIDGKILIVVSSLTGDVDSLIKKYTFKFKILEKQKIFFEELKIYLVWK